MFGRLVVKILVPIVALMLTVGALLYFVVLRTINEFAQQNIEEDLENLTHDLFNVVDREFMQAVKSGKADDRVSLRISQVDCLDILERNTYSRHFKLIVYEERTATIRLASDLPGQMNAQEIIRHFQLDKDAPLLRIGDEDFHVRQFYFSPWDWNVLILKNTQTYAGLSRKVHRVYRASAIVLLIATVLLVIYLLRSVKNPIASIISSVLRGESPDYRGTYEFEFLGRVIGEMRSSLKDSECALQQANEELELRVEERTLELQKTHEQLVHAEKLSAVGKLSASIAHEFNNPLYGVQTVFEGIRRNAPLEECDTELVDLALSECRRVRKLIKDLQDFNRPSSGVRESTDLHAIINDMSALMQKELKKYNIELKKMFSTAATTVRVVPDQMKQVVLNLLTNAKEATEKTGGTITIATEVSNPHVVVRITDTGEGIGPEDVEHIFEPFFTTKSAIKGSGLGLSVSYGIVKAHGGELSVTSSPDNGSTFTITLPLSEKA